MRISVKCSSAVHILLMIAVLSEKQKITSDFLASSVGCNPVEIRKLLSSLKKSGIVDTSRGPGGTALIKDPKTISLLDIYSAVDSDSLNELIGVHTHPAPGCPFGKNISALLSVPYEKIGNAVRNEMSAITLDQLLEHFGQMEPEFYERNYPHITNHKK